MLNSGLMQDLPFQKSFWHLKRKFSAHAFNFSFKILLYLVIPGELPWHRDATFFNLVGSGDLLDIAAHVFVRV
jgi:hypothetical protein